MKLTRRGFLRALGLLGVAAVMPQITTPVDEITESVDMPLIGCLDQSEYGPGDYIDLKWMRPIDKLVADDIDDKIERSHVSRITGWKGKIVFCGVEFDVQSYSLEQTIQYATLVRHNEVSLSTTIFGRVDDLDRVLHLDGPIQLHISDLKGNPDYLIEGYGWITGWTRSVGEEIRTDVTFIVAEIVYNHVS